MRWGGGTFVWCLAAAALVLLTAALFSRYTTFAAFPRFLLAGLALFVLPGDVVLRALDLRPAPLERLALAVPLGAISSGAAYWLLLSIGVNLRRARRPA